MASGLKQRSQRVPTGNPTADMNFARATHMRRRFSGVWFKQSSAAAAAAVVAATAAFTHASANDFSILRSQCFRALGGAGIEVDSCLPHFTLLVQ